MPGPRFIEVDTCLRTLGADALAELGRALDEVFASREILLRQGGFHALPLQDDDIPTTLFNERLAGSLAELLA